MWRVSYEHHVKPHLLGASPEPGRDFSTNEQLGIDEIS